MQTTSSVDKPRTRPAHPKIWALALLVFSLASVRAGTWSAPVAIAGDSDVLTAGSLVWAYHFTFNSTQDATVNGVTFEGVPYTGAGVSDRLVFGNPGSSWGANTAFSGTVPAYTNLSGEYQMILEGAAYWHLDNGSFTLNSLLIGEEYQLQFWVNDARGGAIVGRSDTLVDNTGQQVTLGFNDGVSEAGSLGHYVLYTFTATSVAHDIQVNIGPGGSNNTAQVNAMQLRVVPEPTACLLLMTGAAVVLWRRRRR